MAASLLTLVFPFARVAPADAVLGLEPGNLRLNNDEIGVILWGPKTVPEHFEGGFENLGAQGAFVVSALRDKEGVREVTITSLAGNPVAIESPWPAAKVEVIDASNGTRIAIDFQNGILRFRTAEGHRCRLRKAAC